MMAGIDELVWRELRRRRRLRGQGRSRSGNRRRLRRQGRLGLNRLRVRRDGVEADGDYGDLRKPRSEIH